MQDMVEKIVMIVIGIVVIFYIIAGLASTLISASNNISASGLPLANLFSSGGVVLILLMVGILLFILRLVLRHKGHK